MMIAWGLKDFVFDRHFLDEWTRRFPMAEVHRFEDCGHYILEDAGLEIIPLIREFPREAPDTPGGRMIDAGSANIASGLPSMAGRRPHAPAVLAPSGRDRSGRPRYTFTGRSSSSTARATRSRRASEAIGVGKGVRTVLMVKPSLEFFALTFGLFKAGAVPVLVDPGLGIKNLGPCLAEAEPSGFIGIPPAQAARQALGWGRGSIRTVVTVGRKWPGGGRTLGEVMKLGADSGPILEPMSPDEPAAILFTSGSTGVPKGAVYTHAIFHNQVGMLRDLYRIEPGEVDLCTFPLFALFGPILGMTCVVPEMDATRPGRSTRPRSSRRSRFRRHQPVRLPRLDPPGGRTRGGPRPQVADPPAGDLGRGPGPGAGPGDVLGPAGTGAYKSSPLTGRRNRSRSARSAPTRSWARPDTGPTGGPGSAWVGRSRGCGSRSSRSPTSRSRPGRTTCSSPTARSARSRSGGRS